MIGKSLAVSDQGTLVRKRETDKFMDRALAMVGLGGASTAALTLVCARPSAASPNFDFFKARPLRATVGSLRIFLFMHNMCQTLFTPRIRSLSGSSGFYECDGRIGMFLLRNAYGSPGFMQHRSCFPSVSLFLNS